MKRIFCFQLFILERDTETRLEKMEILKQTKVQDSLCVSQDSTSVRRPGSALGRQVHADLCVNPIGNHAVHK